MDDQDITDAVETLTQEYLQALVHLVSDQEVDLYTDTLCLRTVAQTAIDQLDEEYGVDINY